MEFLRRMNDVITFMENHLMEDFEISEVAKIVCCDVYQFGRIFSYVTGFSLMEYIRKRRLSLAALELQTTRTKVIDVSLKYGYQSPEAFSRAFREMHGITPREACARGAVLKLFPRITFQISLKGDAEMEYRMEKMGVIKGVGISKTFGKWTAGSDETGWKERMGNRWAFWDTYLNGGMDKRIFGYGLYRAPLWQIGVIHTLENGETVESIGAESDGRDYPDLEEFEIPAATWAVFTAKGSLNGSNHPLEKLTTQIFAEWLPSSGYKKSVEYELQVYGPGNTCDDNYTCEIWIPVEKM